MKTVYVLSDFDGCERCTTLANTPLAQTQYLLRDDSRYFDSFEEIIDGIHNDSFDTVLPHQ